MDYSVLYESLQTKTQEYFKSYFETLEKLNSSYSYGASQIVLKDRDYIKGEISEFTPQKKEIELYGKTNQYQKLVEQLKGEITKDIGSNDDPIYS